MDKLSLTALLDEDREMVLANLARESLLASAQGTLEKAVDRVMYRYAEACGDAALRDGAQHILQAMKNALPLMDAVGEARTWNRQGAPAKKGLRPDALALILLLAGLVLVLAAVIGILIGGHLSGALAFVKALLPVALGCGALYWSGARSASPRERRKAQESAPDQRTEFLVDGEKAWHCLRGAMLQADGQLERIRENDVLMRQRQSEVGAAGEPDAPALELFSELLETAYAAGDDGARESASAIRFYLHGSGVDVVDYTPGRETWFEFLPGSRPGTVRPALARGNRLLKKGLASK